MPPKTTHQIAKPGILSSLVTVLAFECLVVTMVGFVFGKMILEKIATDFAMPAGVLFLGISTALLHAWRSGFGKAQVILLAFVWVLFTVSCNGIFANWIMSTLEGKYASSDPFALGKFDVVILLGGATEDSPSGQTQVNANGDRLLQTAALYHQEVTKSIVCTGAAITGLRGNAEADQARAMLIKLGVPDTAIRVIKGRNTLEEVQQIREELPTNAKLGVVTSAWHMGRVMRLARNAKLELSPLPADFRHESMSGWGWARIVRECIPNRDALGLSSCAATEYLARLVSR